MSHAEQIYLGSCLLEPTLIDKGIADGLRSDAFTVNDRRTLWVAMVAARTSNAPTDMQALMIGLGQNCPTPELLSCENAAPTHAYGKKALRSILDAHSLHSLKPALHDVLNLIDDGQSYAEIKTALVGLESVLHPEEQHEHTTQQTVDDAIAWVSNITSGTASLEKTVTTGLKHFDDHCTPVLPHEYIVLGARTSTGKSSFLTQLAGHNLNRGLKIAYFTLETSARAVFLQMAAQRAQVNLRMLAGEPKDKQDRLHRELKNLRSQPIMVFERDLSLEQIESRCRLLTASFKPHLVIIDYLGLIKTKADGAYERMSKLSKAMIPLKKSVGCAMIVAAQLNRGNEKEDRAPTRTDFRDTGSIEEDASRAWILHRPSKDDAGQVQGYDRNIYLQEIYQVKHREGPLCQQRLDFFAQHTLFGEKP